MTVPGSAALNQNFVVWAGDSSSPIFTVQDASGTAVNISTVIQITWTASRTPGGTAVITKTKTGGGIAFVNTGTDGKFQVQIDGTDTAALSGEYVHVATITDNANEITTVATGNLSIGRTPTWTYDPSTMSTKDQVRRLIGDVLNNDQQLQDGEINFALTTYGNIYLAAAECCRFISAQFARQVDIVQGELKTNYSNRTKAYAALAITLDQKGFQRGAGALPYAGGISVADKSSQIEDTDRVTPQFNIGMDDNTLPVGIGSGNLTPSNPAGGNSEIPDGTVN